MMNYKEWKLFTESFSTLGLAQPNKVGGIVGSNLSEEGMHGKIEDDEDEDFDDENEFEDDDMSDEDGFPPDDADEMGSPNGEEEPDMSFLNDIDPDMMGQGGEEGSEEPVATLGGEEEGPVDSMGDEANEEPCPECNHDGSMEIGDENCQTCHGIGFISSEEGEEDLGGEVEVGGNEKDADTAALMQMMSSYMNKYMKKESVLHTEAKKENPFAKMKAKKDAEKCDHKEEKEEPKNKKSSKKEEVKVEKKVSKKSKVKKPEINPFVKESTSWKPLSDEDFFMSLRDDAQGTVYNKNKSGMENFEPKAGEVGFAPNGKIGAIGGGYTKEDIADIPTL